MSQSTLEFLDLMEDLALLEESEYTDGEVI